MKAYAKGPNEATQGQIHAKDEGAALVATYAPFLGDGATIIGSFLATLDDGVEINSLAPNLAGQALVSSHFHGGKSSNLGTLQFDDVSNPQPSLGGLLLGDDLLLGSHKQASIDGTAGTHGMHTIGGTVDAATTELQQNCL